MKTNEYKLPSRVLAVIQGLNPERPRPTEKVFHVTELLMPPYARKLLVEKWDEIVVDYSDSLISAQGDALHEAYAEYLIPLGYQCEIGFEEEIDGITLLGKPDVYTVLNDGVLIDVKQTAVWNPEYKKNDYTIQTNCYAWLLQKHGRKVSKIVIDIWFRNWKLKDSKWSHDYPKIPYEQMELPVWSFEKTEQWIRDQIQYHVMCKDKCSREDKWQKYSCMRGVNGKELKKPDKNCSTREEAEQWIKNWTPAASCLKSMPKGKITWRIDNTEPTNCLHYCNARSVCKYAKSLKGK